MSYLPIGQPLTGLLLVSQVLQIVYSIAFRCSQLLTTYLSQFEHLREESALLTGYVVVILTFVGLCWLAQWCEDEVRGWVSRNALAE